MITKDIIASPDYVAVSISGISLKIISSFLGLFPSQPLSPLLFFFVLPLTLSLPHFPSFLFPSFKPEITYLFTSQLVYSLAFFI